MSTDLGECFVQGIAAGDAGALKQVLAPAVNFRGLTPGRYWESDDADVVVDEVILGTWFSPECTITGTLGIERATVGEVGRVGYRFRARFPDGDYAIEQQAYFRSEAGRISWLRVLCSGFVHE